MGGSGSGSWYRWDSKTTIESQYKIDVRWMKKQGLLVPGTAGTLSWSCRGKESGYISYRLGSDRLILNYRSRQSGGEWESIEDKIYFTWTPCNYGGRRQWFLCPRCNRRVAIVYGGKYFCCRHCHNLTYSSQQEGKSDRLMEKARKIRKRMGGGDNLLESFPWKPKNMHWKTYWRLREESEQANCQSLILGAKRLGLHF